MAAAAKLQQSCIPVVSSRNRRTVSRCTWIKGFLKIQSFLGTAKNTVKTQIRIAMSAYLLVAIVRQRLETPPSLHAMLQVLSLSLFERVHLPERLAAGPPEPTRDGGGPKQQLLFEGQGNLEAPITPPFNAVAEMQQCCI